MSDPTLHEKIIFMYMTRFGLIHFDTTSCHVSIKMTRESLLVGYCLYLFFIAVPSYIWIYTIFIYFFFNVKVKKFWFVNQRWWCDTVYTHTVLIHTHALMHLHKQITPKVILTIQNTKKNNKNKSTRNKYIQNNTSKPAFLCKIGGRQKI